jgi:hypothetical protein
MNLMKKALQALLPNGKEPGGPWDDKFNGADLEKFITGLSMQYERDRLMVDKLRYVLDPSRTEFIPELEAEFTLPPGELTDDERRGRIDGRFQLMAETKLRLAVMEFIFELSGFSGVTFRTLGWNGTPETSFDFFDNVGSAYYGANAAIYGSNDMVYGAVATTGGAFLVTNGGSVEYAYRGEQAYNRLRSEYWYHGAYFICEGTGGVELEIPERFYETFWDLLYLVKPASMHGILRASFI